MDKVYKLKLFNLYYKKIDGKWYCWSSLENTWFLSSMYENGRDYEEFPYGDISDYKVITENEMEKD